ncbi:hypothetical protein VitviT2T_010707 [Vitis vinifera]|uniref:Uncharacterized protein n=2 Tax=Vitis vinifera TaxID=29760 RepID=F6GZH7_VITVI|nr:uncharacterized protein LOC104878641 [Vitis vinifera]XP_034691431.1 uncharacterized protein LOC117918704 [Vitis riparia]RVX23267.1 hypothetical protein CK203_000491 [Vitis vinifera]WJZ91656.1 hypothetical protein VitviT2T_010707 [Vitis vinifera]|eukprot:XP_010647540.1 PREDICTED: uncharacterized protein LOC104878641 [Vitis vinifera]
MTMVASEAGGKCKKHPEQEQLPGVCSACLRERLSQLYGCKSQNKAVNMMGVSSCSSLSSSPPYSSASSSTLVSPNRSNHYRRASEVTAKIAMVIGGGHGGGLKKSRSVAVVPSGRGGDGKTKKGGFWSKLLRSRGDRSKRDFMHSKWRLD